MEWTGVEALEPWERVAVAGELLRRWASSAGDAAVHPRSAALRAGGRAPSAWHGGRRRHAEQPFDNATGADSACLHCAEPCGG